MTPGRHISSLYPFQPGRKAFQASHLCIVALSFMEL
jgi:hypothetical protein